MSDLTDFAEKLLLDWLMTAGAATRPTAWWVALHTGAPGDNGAASEVGAGVGYTRQSVTFAAAASPGGTTDNTTTVTFGPASGAGFGAVTHMSIWDSSAAGNSLWQGTATNKTIPSGDKYEFAVGAIDLTMA